METASLRLLDSILLNGLRAAEAAATAHPDQSRNFRMIMAMLWSARDELDLVREAPRLRAPQAIAVTTIYPTV